MTTVEVHAVADNDGNTWWCQAATNGPASGLFAFGATFGEARRNLAEVVLEQLNSSGTAVKKVRIFCVTRKTFRVTDGALTP